MPGFDFTPWDEERRQRLPQGLMGLVQLGNPNAYDEFLRSMAAGHARYGVMGEQKPPQPDQFRPDLALNKLKKSATLSPGIVGMLTRRGEI